ncbi:hypothetical protein C3941_19515 [Kaistia algarum]|uniref:DUF3850 domain-containing protein n=1 Tax=Kaistia algarum TaxID=2083279 RepID=UPI000CE921F9|nr:DUF3850 domain-containing protein [Kaistia algarum]MCX5516181.1 DUF3850 domain-containing protein [Kaistia algarum]PPE78255.1 hypothetical protein C3941_19515 [Kaistia algarum]
MAEHILKTVAGAWDAVERGDKRFEVRRNDRFFQPGDTVILRRIMTGDPGPIRDYDGEFRDLTFRIGWFLQGGQFGVEPGYCVFQLEPVRAAA